MQKRRHEVQDLSMAGEEVVSEQAAAATQSSSSNREPHGDEGSSSSARLRYICSFPDCDATFNKGWKLEAHLCKHTGEVSAALGGSLAVGNAEIGC